MPSGPKTDDPPDARRRRSPAATLPHPRGKRGAGGKKARKRGNGVCVFTVTLPPKKLRMDFRITAELPADGPHLRPESRVMLMGSCFAEHVGRRMAGAGLRAEVNPFGVLYNPESLRLGLTALLDGLPGDDVFFEGRDGLWHSWLHSGAFSAPTREACRRAVTDRLTAAARALRQADVLFVTFGTADVYTLADGRPVANCHKEPAATFRRRRLAVDEIVDGWLRLIGRLRAARAGLQVVLTVSPYRYAKLGLHGSQLTKAVLLLATDGICRGAEGCFYFPAYEIVTDELRDYRFYDRDMLHPSAQAVDYVWERLGSWCFTPSMHAFLAECEALDRRLTHRPLHPGSAAHLDFLHETARRLERLAAELPRLDLSARREALRLFTEEAQALAAKRQSHTHT